MTNESYDKQSEQICGDARKLPSGRGIESPAKVRARRERLLALLKSRYGYINEQAVDEMERLLKQFVVTNRSLGIVMHTENKAAKD